jgi:hypothetical protein
MGYLQTLLLLFEAVSGMKVNLAKSELIPVGNIDHTGSLAGILGFGVSTLLVQYLSQNLEWFRSSRKAVSTNGNDSWIWLDCV